MTKEQFISRLRRELKKLPPEEIVAATEYYEEYFEESLARAEDSATEFDPLLTEEKLVAELGSPKSVAAQIKAEYASRVFSEDETALNYKPTVGHKISAFWWVILGILAAPVGIPLVIVVLALLIAFICVIIALYAAIAGIAVGAVGFFAGAVLSVTSSGSAAIMLLGAALAAGGLAVICAIGLTLLVKKLIGLAASGLARRKRRAGTQPDEEY